MTDAPDELESAMILGDPDYTVSLDTIRAMARAVRDAGFARQHYATTYRREVWHCKHGHVHAGIALDRCPNPEDYR